MEVEKIEQILKKLHIFLADALPEVLILKNHVLGVSMPETGIVLIKDGTIDAPEYILSSAEETVLYTHRVQLDILVQSIDAATRDQKSSDLLKSVVDVLSPKESLFDGLVEGFFFGVPVFTLEVGDDGIAIKIVTLEISLQYYL
ncbi:hypothetical protein [Rickettsia endosymbiont of Cardiosporidium cionae]|uniref:hypothetical protein n=1 Tax=Rickettsia endosymbiont of Cardiosporidium cionae TaxID=2777155 RepID=UPI001894C8C5|nr:hypothetical protein [Rickettsia endosymbiont of Cardiosporidium cionae]KAF8818077.1 hypothetical protein IHI24_000876 [Rickettsia endosymbiont of Cardiosporidium cionae]